MYKPLKKRKMSSHSGPLQKMINAEVESRMSALKATEGQGDTKPVWGEFAEKSRRMLEDGRTEITEARTGTTPGDNYDGSGGYAPDDQWLAFLETPEGEEYTKNTAPREVEEERLRFLEAVPEAIEPKELEAIEPNNEQPELETVQRQQGQATLAETLGMNPDQAGSLTKNANEFFDMSFSSDNPTFDFMKDDKFMQKARKLYNKENLSSKQKQTMPFKRWLMQNQTNEKFNKMKSNFGIKGNILDSAKGWEGDNAKDTDSSNEGGAVNREISQTNQTRGGRGKPGNYSDQVESSDQPNPETVGQFKMNRNTSSKGQSKMIKAFGKPMSFRNNKH